MALRYQLEGIWYRLGWSPRHGALPHAIKRSILRQYALDYHLRVLVETGTYLGDMMMAMAANFDELHSIELSALLYERARRRLAGRRNVHLYQGDSGIQLSSVLATIDRPTLFWLDAHYSGGITAHGEIDTPINTELRVVLTHPVKDHVVLIDDACLFTSASGYPSIEALKEYVRQVRPDCTVSVENDIIRITPAVRP